MSTLIIGGDSLIGSELACRLRKSGAPVQSSTRHADRSGDERPLIDLALPLRGFRLPSGVRTAVLCAAVTSQQECSDRPDRARLVNVEAVIRLGDMLARAGVFTIFLSSNLVFDGSRPNMPADSPYRPIGLYGAQKAEAERCLGDIFANGGLAIVRLTKVLHSGVQLLKGWRASLDRGEVIRPFGDVSISPISLSFVVGALEKIAAGAVDGVLQLSARDEVSYAGLAVALARSWRCDPDLIIADEGRKRGGPIRDAPAHGSLDAERASRLMGIVAPTLLETVDELGR